MIVEFRTMKSTKVPPPIGQDDLQVAEIVLVNNLTLVTHNMEEFGYIDGFQFEDWKIEL